MRLVAPGTRSSETVLDRLKATAVRSPSGALALVHHATGGTYDAADMLSLSHFGTRSAAKYRRETMPDARLISAFLDIRNPLWIADINDNHSSKALAELIDAVTEGAIFGSQAIADLELLSDSEAACSIVEGLCRHGYDGLCYKNSHEDPGSSSWIPVTADQIIVVNDGLARESADAWSLSDEDITKLTMTGDMFDFDGRVDDYDHLWECLDIDGPDLPVIQRNHEGWEARWIPDWAPTETTALFDPTGKPSGFYMGGMVWVDETVRGRGLSALMILATAELKGGSPLGQHQGMGFSPAGMAAHLSALRHARAEAVENGYIDPPDGYTFEP